MTKSAAGRVGLVCLGGIGAAVIAAWPLRCLTAALGVGAVAAAAGAALGIALAAITRTRRPALIYFFLGLAALTLVPLVHPWPGGDSADVTLWPGAPDILYNYFDFLRGAAYLFAMPYPFARFGRHKPDADEMETSSGSQRQE